MCVCGEETVAKAPSRRRREPIDDAVVSLWSPFRRRRRRLAGRERKGKGSGQVVVEPCVPVARRRRQPAKSGAGGRRGGRAAACRWAMTGRRFMLMMDGRDGILSNNRREFGVVLPFSVLLH